MKSDPEMQGPSVDIDNAATAADATEAAATDDANNAAAAPIPATSAAPTAQRVVRTLVIGLVMLSLLAFASLMIGVDTANNQRAFSLLSLDAWRTGSLENAILWVRIPRVLAVMLVGAALASAGTGLQAMLRNPLAEPYTLGISAGAALASVLAIRFGIEAWLGASGVTLAALSGAALALVVVWRLAQQHEALPPATLVLAGVTVSMFCSAISVIVQYTSDFAVVSRMLRWMMGGFEAMRMVTLAWSSPVIVLGIGALWARARELNLLAAGSDFAASVGVNVVATQRLIFVVASLLVGVAIAIAGPIGFVGLIVPHAMRSLLGPDHRRLVPMAAMGGAGLLLFCDGIARMAVAPAQLPAGAVTAALGGPFFIAILLGHRRAQLLGRVL